MNKKAGTIGVYAIVNKLHPMERRYVGSSVNIPKRFASHRSALRTGRHPNKPLQAAWNKYGSAAFEFEIIRICRTEKEATHCEQGILNVLHSTIVYNTNPVAGRPPNHTGRKRSPETIAKIKSNRKPFTWTAEMRTAMSAKKKGCKQPPRGPDYRANLSASLKASPVAAAGRSRGAEKRRGSKASLETRMKQSAAKVGKKQSPENIEKRIAPLRGKALAEEHKAKIGSGNRGKVRTDAVRANISASLTGRQQSQETRDRRSRSLVEAWKRRKEHVDE